MQQPDPGVEGRAEQEAALSLKCDIFVTTSVQTLVYVVDLLLHALVCVRSKDPCTDDELCEGSAWTPALHSPPGLFDIEASFRLCLVQATISDLVGVLGSPVTPDDPAHLSCPSPAIGHGPACSSAWQTDTDHLSCGASVLCIQGQEKSEGPQGLLTLCPGPPLSCRSHQHPTPGLVPSSTGHQPCLFFPGSWTAHPVGRTGRPSLWARAEAAPADRR